MTASRFHPKNITAALALGYAAVFVALIAFHPGSETFYKAFNNVYEVVAPLFAAICGLVAARQRHSATTATRAAWLLIGLAALSFGGGQITWTVLESVLGIKEMPSPGPADLGYLGAYPLLIAGVFLLFGSMQRVGRVRLLVDSALTAGSVGVLSWYFVVAALWRTPDVGLLGKLVSVAYPLGDLVALFGAIVLLRSRGNRDLRRSLVCLAGGLVLLAFADTMFTWYNLRGMYQTGSWFDWGWSFGWLLVGFAALVPVWWPVKDIQPAAERVLRAPRLVVMLGPYLAVALSFAMVLWNDLQDGTVQLNVVLAGVALVVLVFLRQVLTLIENHHLTTQLQLFSSDLERQVVRRTDQLAGLLRLTKAVNSTLVFDQVIDAALDSTLPALQCDAVVIRMLDETVPPSVMPPRIVAQTGLAAHSEISSFIEKLPVSDGPELLAVPYRADGQPAQAPYLRTTLRWQQQTLGMIGVLRWHEGFTPADAEMLDSIGVEVGTALANARVYAIAVQAADCDSVSGLYNHRAIHQRLEQEIVLAKQQGLPLTVIMMDLNNFKRFNDTYGHPVGDQVLKQVAKVLETECRSGDILARYGGDEFLAVLPRTDNQTALQLAHRLRQGMTKAGLWRVDEQRTIPVSLSFGLATFPGDSENRHELIAIADANLYAAKQSEDGIRGSTRDERTNRQLRAEGTYEVLDALVAAIDNKDRYTRHHSEDVAEYALWIAEEMALSAETLRIIRIGCLLHDVGKIGVSDDVLRKPGRLTDDEYEVMKRHPRLGAVIVGALPGMETILDIVRSHHERWDGRGYPDGLQGEEIPLLGRIAAIADAFSAMTTDRLYRKAFDWPAALEEIRRNSGSQFDPTITDCFLWAARQRLQRGDYPRATVAGNVGRDTTDGPSSPEQSPRALAHTAIIDPTVLQSAAAVPESIFCS